MGGLLYLCHVPSREVKSDTESLKPLSLWPGQCLAHPEAIRRVTPGVISLKQKVLLSLREGRGIFEALGPGS